MIAQLRRKRTITADDIQLCTQLSGDAGVHHTSGVGGRQMAQGILSMTAVPLLGNPQVHLTEVELAFVKPVFAGDTIVGQLDIQTVGDLGDGRCRLTCTLNVGLPDERTVVSGTVTAVVPRALADSLRDGSTSTDPG